MNSVEKTALIIIIAIIIVPFVARGEEMDTYAHALEGTTLLGKTECLVKKQPPYLVPCIEYEDKNYRYYSLAKIDGEVIVINRISKTNPNDVTVHWVADSLKEALKYYERTHSF